MSGFAFDHFDKLSDHSSVTIAQAPDYIRQKLTKHEVTAGAPKKLILQQP